MKLEIIDAVLEDVVDRIVEEDGVEVSVLDWGILEDIRDAVRKSGEDLSEYED